MNGERLISLAIGLIVFLVVVWFLAQLIHRV